MVILVDMDDTIETLGPAWCDWLDKKYDTGIKYEDLTGWIVADTYPQLTKEQIFEPLFLPELWDTVKPIDGAAEYLKRMMDDGDEIYILTSTHYKNVAMKMDKVLFKFFPFLNRRQIIIADKKQMIKGDILIDDAPHNLMGGDYEKILLDAPTNRNFKEGIYDIHRAFSWEQVYEIVHEIKSCASWRGFKGIKV